MAITYKILKKVQVPYRPGYDITALFTDDITSTQRSISYNNFTTILKDNFV